MVSTGKGVKNMREELRKSKTDRRICGVCGGIADYIGVDSNVVRLIWAAITLFAGAGLLLYIIAAIILPEEEIEERDLKDVIHPEESGEDKEA
jgi:phage shock protein PspC (stress-responsive transcriptional regulator)